MKASITSPKERDQTLDCIKGIAILLVVLGHSIQFGNGASFFESRAFYSDPVFKFIYSFHMPLFMLVSGYLFARTIERHSTKAIVSSRMTKLLIPIFTWTAFTFVVHFILHRELDFNQFITQFFTKLWFLWAIFWCSSIVLTVHRLGKDSKVVYLILFLITFFLPDSHDICSYSFMYPFFVVGYFFHKEKQTVYLRMPALNDRYLLGALAFTYFALMYFYSFDSYIYTSGYTVLGKNALSQVGIDLYRFLVGFAGSLFVVYCVHVLTRKKVLNKGWSLLAKLGEASLGIYTLSIYIQTLQVVRNAPQSKNYAVNVLETILVVAFCYWITNLLKRFKILNAAFLGGR